MLLLIAIPAKVTPENMGAFGRTCYALLLPFKEEHFQRESNGVQHVPGGRTMRGKRFTEEQIIGILKEAEAGLPVPDLLRKHGISQGTFYRWKAKFGGMEVSEARRLKALEDENRRLKRLVADQALDIQILKEINTRKW